jgi:NAD(P)-dependent dehydrogenase (short-subunit alcohol dehydrogenase family)
MHVHGRVAVITGAASGLGLAMAHRFARSGMTLVLADIESDRLNAAVRDLREEGHIASGVVTDVSDPAAVTHLADVAFETHGGVHVLCNNAGVVKRARTWDLTLSDWAWVMGVDFWSVVHGVRAFVPRMLGQNAGHIVNTASMAALLPMPNLSAYAAAKSAVVALSMSLQTEFEQCGAPLGVSVLCPGFIATAITNSDRNRPAELADEAAAPDVPRTTHATVSTMTADAVADEVIDAVSTDRFWILTHQEYRPVIQQHAEHIGTPQGPVPAPIW